MSEHLQALLKSKGVICDKQNGNVRMQSITQLMQTLRLSPLQIVIVSETKPSSTPEFRLDSRFSLILL